MTSRHFFQIPIILLLHNKCHASTNIKETNNFMVDYIFPAKCFVLVSGVTLNLSSHYDDLIGFFETETKGSSFCSNYVWPIVLSMFSFIFVNALTIYGNFIDSRILIPRIILINKFKGLFHIRVTTTLSSQPFKMKWIALSSHADLSDYCIYNMYTHVFDVQFEYMYVGWTNEPYT